MSAPKNQSGRGAVPEPKTVRHIVDGSGLLRFKTLQQRVLEMLKPEQGWSALVEAIDGGRYDEYLNEGSPIFPDPAQPEASSPTLLYLCCLYAPQEVAEALLRRGADPRVTSGVPEMSRRHPAPPLVAAASSKRSRLAKALLDAGADPDLGLPISRSVCQGDRATFDVLVAAGAELDVNVGDDDTLMQRALAYRQFTEPSGILDAIRTAIAAKRGAVGRTLRVKKRRSSKPTGEFSTFARPRLSAGFSWVLFAAEGGCEGVARAFAPEGARIEQDVARRRVVAVEGVFTFKLCKSNWTWHLFAITARHQDVAKVKVDELAGSAAKRLGRTVLGWAGMEIVEATPAAESTKRLFTPESVGDEQGARQVTPTHEREALARMDAFCASRGLRLPDLRDVSDGFELGLEIVGCAEDEIEMLDATVTR